jgi:hypothetical protein
MIGVRLSHSIIAMDCEGLRAPKKDYRRTEKQAIRIATMKKTIVNGKSLSDLEERLVEGNIARPLSGFQYRSCGRDSR